MGGRSRSRSSTTTSQQEILTTTTDNRVAQDGGDIGGNISVSFADTTAESTLNDDVDSTNTTPNSGSTDNQPITGNQVNIQTSDFGAVQFAGDLADRLLFGAGQAIDSAVELAGSATDSARENARDVLQASENFVESDSTEIIKVVAVGAVVLGVAYFAARKL